MAAMDAAMGKVPPPFEVIEMGLCERFHKLPEELDDIDWSRLLTGLDLLEVFNTFQKWRAGEKLSEGEQTTFKDMAEADYQRQQMGA
jgi:hypothetical protein